MQILLTIGLVAINGLRLAIDLGASGQGDEYHKMLFPIIFITGLVAPSFIIVVGVSIPQKWTARRKTPNILYVLTDRGAIVRVSNPKTKGVAYTTFHLGRLGGVHRLAYLDGSGDLGFHHISNSYFGREEFIGVPDVRRVEGLVRQILRAVDHPSVKIMYDIFRAHIEEKDQGRTIVSCAAETIHVHISENDRGVPGTGQVQWDSFWSGLQHTGYDGYLTVEAFGRSPPALATAAKVWRVLFPEPMALCRDDLTFIRERAGLR